MSRENVLNRTDARWLGTSLHARLRLLSKTMSALMSVMTGVTVSSNSAFMSIFENLMFILLMLEPGSAESSTNSLSTCSTPNRSVTMSLDLELRGTIIEGASSVMSSFIFLPVELLLLLSLSSASIAFPSSSWSFSTSSVAASPTLSDTSSALALTVSLTASVLRALRSGPSMM